MKQVGKGIFFHFNCLLIILQITIRLRTAHSYLLSLLRIEFSIFLPKRLRGFNDRVVYYFPINTLAPIAEPEDIGLQETHIMAHLTALLINLHL